MDVGAAVERHLEGKGEEIETDEAPRDRTAAGRRRAPLAETNLGLQARRLRGDQRLARLIEEGDRFMARGHPPPDRLLPHDVGVGEEPLEGGAGSVDLARPQAGRRQPVSPADRRDPGKGLPEDPIRRLGVPGEGEKRKPDRVAQHRQRDPLDAGPLSLVEVDHSCHVPGFAQRADDVAEAVVIAVNALGVGPSPREDLLPVLSEPTAEDHGALADRGVEVTDRLEERDSPIRIPSPGEGERVDEPC